MLFKLSNLNSNLALTLGYRNPALNNSALELNLRNKKRAECIVELYKHAGIFKNMREMLEKHEPGLLTTTPSGSLRSVLFRYMPLFR